MTLRILFLAFLSLKFFVLFCFKFFGDKVSSNLGRPWTHCITQTGLELLIFLPPPPSYWEYRCALSHLAPLHLYSPAPYCRQHLVTEWGVGIPCLLTVLNTQNLGKEKMFEKSVRGLTGTIRCHQEGLRGFVSLRNFIFKILIFLSKDWLCNKAGSSLNKALWKHGG